MHLKLNYLCYSVLLMILIIESTKATLCGNIECRGLNSKCDLNGAKELVCECLNGSIKTRIDNGTECVDSDLVNEDSDITEIPNETSFPNDNKEINGDGEIFLETTTTDNPLDGSEVKEEKGDVKEKCVDGSECDKTTVTTNFDFKQNDAVGSDHDEIFDVNSDYTATTTVRGSVMESRDLDATEIPNETSFPNENKEIKADDEILLETTTIDILMGGSEDKEEKSEVNEKCLEGSECDGTTEINKVSDIDQVEDDSTSITESFTESTTSKENLFKVTNKEDQAHNEDHTEEDISVYEHTENMKGRIGETTHKSISTLDEGENPEFGTIQNAAAIKGQQINATSEHSNFDDMINIFGFGDINCAPDQIQCQAKCCDNQYICNKLGECVTKTNEISTADANTSTAAVFYTVIGLGCIVAALGFALFQLHKFNKSTTF